MEPGVKIPESGVEAREDRFEIAGPCPFSCAVAFGPFDALPTAAGLRDLNMPSQL